MFRAAREGKQRLASKENGSRRAGPRHEGSSSAANNVTSRANARALIKQFGRDGAVILPGMRESILETLSFLEAGDQQFRWAWSHPDLLGAASDGQIVALRCSFAVFSAETGA
jgi:hypothetical protein